MYYSESLAAGIQPFELRSATTGPCNELQLNSCTKQLTLNKTMHYEPIRKRKCFLSRNGF